ncbi:MAG: 50S ribosomal protein L22 [candidate division TA06 bacterium ADurb.Bin131]|jgi:large subunit ribosomal protein L22|uniref:Large ribosomal subunit protein uL22 n=1 Tax=candidate division TA06 bacterium ADurb.Bin131 TaxID=1852827 RepID=A0A1V6C4D8_UNCT6|nr:MAG: 50S ribosomal protein L22 [candidate division TA06 bacterium ADurb.Bin131]HOC03019.1 50S ribosomal protein L22 [bacterium]HRV03712.1 50S ribosomal protein L22 [Candidatus Ratteibacteria bacterium]HON04874.1 50S ribosomal protein L22 [bacterium]HPC29462.1 50S ribosomal protein L22 [bacterium]
MEVIAKTKFARVSPRKLRYLRPVVINKEAESAIEVLKNIPNSGAVIIRKLIKSALSNAGQKKPEQKLWYVKNLLIDEGPRMKRMRSAPMGRAVVIQKKLSHLKVILEEIPESQINKRNIYGTKGKSNRA